MMKKNNIFKLGLLLAFMLLNTGCIRSQIQAPGKNNLEVEEIPLTKTSPYLYPDPLLQNNSDESQTEEPDRVISTLTLMPTRTPTSTVSPQERIVLGDDLLPGIYFATSKDGYMLVRNMAGEVVKKIRLDVFYGADIHPDQKHMVFSDSNGDLFIFDLEDGTTKRVGHTEINGFYPSWAPDGEKIVFEAFPDAIKEFNTVLSIYDFSTKETIRIISSDLKGGAAKWATNGRKIAFLSDLIIRDLFTSEIFMIDSTCFNNDQYMCDKKAHRLIIDDYWINAPIIWSPDSTMLSFSCTTISREKGGVCIYDIGLEKVIKLIEIIEDSWDIIWLPNNGLNANTYEEENDYADRVIIEKVDGSNMIIFLHNDNHDERFLFWFVVE